MVHVVIAANLAPSVLQCCPIQFDKSSNPRNFITAVRIQELLSALLQEHVGASIHRIFSLMGPPATRIVGLPV
jgi:hypothetical protein